MRKAEGENVNFVICSFGKRWRGAKRRIKRQIFKFYPQASLYLFTEKELVGLNQISSLIESVGSDTPGYGNWLWKPLIIQHVFESLSDGAVLIYMDVGCELNKRGKSRFLELVQKASREGYVLFGLSDDAIDFITPQQASHFKLSTDDLKLKKMYSATALFMAKGHEITNQLLEEWASAARNFPLLFDGEKSAISGRDGNRHDQSVLTCIAAKLELNSISDELDTEESKKTTTNLPILAIRNRFSFSMAPNGLGHRIRTMTWRLRD